LGEKQTPQVLEKIKKPRKQMEGLESSVMSCLEGRRSITALDQVSISPAEIGRVDLTGSNSGLHALDYDHEGSRRSSEAVVKNFRREWVKACVEGGLGEKTGKAWYRYKGLVPHHFRRSAVRNLVNAVADTATAMKITGRRTLHIFMRYNIISTGQLHEAMEKVTSEKKAAK
jgi:hypothetical protein